MNNNMNTEMNQENALRVFDFENRQVRTVQKDGETWWVLRDVCEILEIGNSRMVSDRLDEDEKDDVSITDAIGRQQNTTVISESGLYNVILLSRKPEAKKFKRWVTHEVLPIIRKHGAYMTPETAEQVLLNPDTVINLAQQIKESREVIRVQEQRIADMRPKEIFADAVSATNDCILIRELAKILRQKGIDTGEKRLFEWMRNNGYLIRKQGRDYNSPTQRAMDMGLFQVKETSISHSDGHASVKITTKVTGKGQLYFVNAFLGGAA